ncbi:MAG: DNA mismatch repair protein MutS [Candidatus Dependentiae bacterium]|jgi:DNA mismatch repair protein MutS
MTKKQTPLMAQYFEIRQQYPDAMLLFQVGDFYELFFDDAINASQFLAITLTKRGKNNGEDIPLCGVPVHALSHYLVKLVKGGFTVALCDQVSKPMPGTVVKRAVTRVYSPGTLTDAQLLDEKAASYVCTVVPHAARGQYGVLFTELLTAHVAATTISSDNPRLLEAELGRFFPDEVVIPPGQTEELKQHLLSLGYTVTPFRSHADETPLTPDDMFRDQTALPWLQERFAEPLRTQLEKEASVLGSMELLYRYLSRNQPSSLEQLSSISFYEPASFVQLDPATQRNLELVTNSEGGKGHTLFRVIDRAQTAMGSRLLKKWLLRPLRSHTTITQRQEVVHALVNDVATQQQLRTQLRAIADIERIVGRIALQRAVLADYKTLRIALTALTPLKAVLQPLRSVPLLEQLLLRLPAFTDLISFLANALNEDEAVDGLIKQGFSERLDRLRHLINSGQQEVMKLGQKEGEAHGIPSLKIGYTSVSGYFIEVTNTHVSKVPEHYSQVQKLAGRSRYITTELKALEREIAQAREECGDVEKELWAEVEAQVRTYTAQLRQAAHALATIDALGAFADLAYTFNYTQPTFNTEGRIAITAGRHPVVEQSLHESFIANDTSLGEVANFWIITGPNMGGKSTYLRQVALISVLAQIGSFVPADSADLPLVDRIFTRIGAGDNVAQGKSTFLVEMEETATICSQATIQSLVILDEVGRGTSTEDGRALAQAIIEYLVNHVGARTLFATHYHELTLLANADQRIANYHMSCHKKGGTLHFLHTLVPGVAQASFGIDVAKLAHLPKEVIVRARELLKNAPKAEAQLTLVAATSGQSHSLVCHPRKSEDPDTDSMTNAEREVLEELARINVDDLSPKAAFDLLWQIKPRLKR